MRVQLHAIAAGIGLTYELLTGDLSQVNYSSIRAGLLEFRRRMEALQWQLLVPGLCRPVWQRFVATAQAIGVLPPGTIEAEWTAPRFEAVDPLKDIQADILAVRGGLMTLKEAIARQGYDPAHGWPRSAPPTPSSMRSASCSIPIRARRPRPALPRPRPEDEQA